MHYRTYYPAWPRQALKEWNKGTKFKALNGSTLEPNAWPKNETSPSPYVLVDIDVMYVGAFISLK